MRGWSLVYRPSRRETIAEARSFFTRALAIDPANVSALIGLARSHTDDVARRWSQSPAEQLRSAEEAVDRALSLAPQNAMAHYVRGEVLRNGLKLEAGLAAFERALALNPNLVEAQARLGFVKILQARSREALADVERAIRLSPRDPLMSNWAFWMCHAHMHLEEDERAIEWCRRSVDLDPNGVWIWPYLDLAASYAHLGRDAEARAALSEVRQRAPDFTIASYRAARFSNNPVWLKEIERLYAGLRKAGLPEGAAPPLDRGPALREPLRRPRAGALR
jgi:adenylate cyclase